MASKYKAVNQMNAIIGEIMESSDYPRWDYINGVLSCKSILGEFDLWLHWDMLLIVPQKDKYKDKCARDFEQLEDWNTEKDGTITLIGNRW